MMRKQGDGIEGINRRGLIVAVPDTVAREARRLTDDCLLDGEAVGDILHVFDVLESAGVDFPAPPYTDRLDMLNGLIPMAFTAIQPVYTARTAK